MLQKGFAYSDKEKARVIKECILHFVLITAEVVFKSAFYERGYKEDLINFPSGCLGARFFF